MSRALAFVRYGTHVATFREPALSRLNATAGKPQRAGTTSILPTIRGTKVNR